MPSLTKKPWGSEIRYTNKTLPYTGKILTINKNHRTSLQKHSEKIETITLYKGQCVLTIGKKNIQMKVLEGYTIMNNQIHRITAIKRSTILEVSTPEIGLTFRIEDDYSRQNEILSS